MRSPHGCIASAPMPKATWRSCSMPPPTRKPLPERRFMPDTPVRPQRPATLGELEDHGAFQRRHIGPDAADQQAMCELLGFASRDALIDAVVPKSIRRKRPMDVGEPRSEAEALTHLRAVAER